MALRNVLGDLALDDTVLALKTVSDNILVAVGALNAAVDALSAKTIKSDTDHVSVSNFPSTQAVALDVASLSALETISVGNFPATQPVSGTVAVSNMVGQGLTDSQLRASDVKVTLDSEAVALDSSTLAALETISVANFPATQSVSGTVVVSNMVAQGLTDAQLRASDVKVTLDGEAVSISNQLAQPVTDTQLRATDVKVTLDGEQVTVSNFPATQAVSGPITNAELRASAVPVSLDSSGISSTDLQLEILNMLRLVKTTLTRLPFYDPSLNRAKMTTVVESGTVTTVTTCGTVTNMTNVGSYAWDAMVRMQNRSSWANTCGNRIS